MNKIHAITSACAVLSAASVAQAGFDFNETNNILNNSYLTADVAGVITTSDHDLVGQGHIGTTNTTNSDVDWYSFVLSADAVLQFATGATTSLPYGMSLQLLDSAGNVLAGDAELGSSGDTSPTTIQATMLLAGTYYVGISGYDGDVANNGNSILDGKNAGIGHGFNFDYVLSIEAVGLATVPVPTAALAGLGLLLPFGAYRSIKRRR